MSVSFRSARRHAPVVAATVLALCGALVAAPAPVRAESPPITATAGAATTAGDDHINQVLAISIDGLNPDAIRELGPDGAPHLHRLIAEGVSTLNGRTAVESTSTLPNHTGMFTSLRVHERHGGHGVAFNDDDDRTTVHRAAGRYVPSIFDVVHDRGRRTALYTSKDKFALYNRSWSRRHGAPDRVGRDNGRDKIDRFTYREDEDVLLDLLLDDLGDGAAPFTFLHLSRTDKVGHQHGYLSEAYLDEVRAEDARVGLLLRLIDTTPRLRRHLVVILTSDHGGLGTSHSAVGDRVNYTIPLMVWGRGIAAGADLYAMNPDYADPGTARPRYAADRQPVRNAVVGNLAADLIDLPRIPGSQMNSRRDLLVLSD